MLNAVMIVPLNPSKNRKYTGFRCGPIFHFYPIYIPGTWNSWRVSPKFYPLDLRNIYVWFYGKRINCSWFKIISEKVVQDKFFCFNSFTSIKNYAYICIGSWEFFVASFDKNDVRNSAHFSFTQEQCNKSCPIGTHTRTM